jgi:hypothetical protein
MHNNPSRAVVTSSASSPPETGAPARPIAHSASFERHQQLPHAIVQGPFGARGQDDELPSLRAQFASRSDLDEDEVAAVA